MVTRCPTCRAAVEVTGSGTTQHYEPLAERVAEVVQLMRDARLNRGTVMVDEDTYYAAMAHLAKWEAARED